MKSEISGNRTSGVHMRLYSCRKGSVGSFSNASHTSTTRVIESSTHYGPVISILERCVISSNEGKRTFFLVTAVSAYWPFSVTNKDSTSPIRVKLFT